MKNQYRALIKQWCLVALGVMSFMVSARAQPVQPPVIQWQAIVELAYSNTALQGQVQAVKASNGGYAVLTADIGTLVRFSANGDVIWKIRIPTILNEQNVSILETTGLAATADGGFGILARDSFGWYLARVDANGNRVWVKQLDNHTNSSFTTRFRRSLISTSDGGFFEVGSSGDIKNSGSATCVKYDKDGNISQTKSIVYESPQPNEIRYFTNANRAIETTDGFIIVGLAYEYNYNTFSQVAIGWAAKLNDQGSIIWQKLYPERRLLDDIIPSPYFDGLYIASGINNLNANVSNSLNLDADGTPGGGFYQPGRVVASNSSIVAVPTANGKPAYHTVLDESSQNNGDFRLTNLAKSDQLVWTKTLGGSGNDVPQDIITTEDGGYVVVGTTTSTDGDVQGRSGNSVATWIVKLSPAAPANALTLTQPTYNCQTGAITFNISGGDGSPIVYTAPGITRANVTDNVGTVEQGLRNDPKPITISATQSGYTASYTFDFGAYCSNTPTNGTLQLLAPSIKCGDNDVLLTINTTGGNGSPITYAVPGATLSSPANNTASVYQCINNNTPSLTIQAMQSGYTATYSVNLRAACPLTEFGQPLTTRQIPDLTLSVGQTLQSFDVTPYFSDPNRIPKYALLAQYTFSATGMPVGITYSTEGTNGNNKLVAKFLGTASDKPGTYKVTITAGTVFCDPVTSSFNIIVVDQSGSSGLTLTQPTYNCQTGAITFNTTGGNGSSIVYTAPGITRSAATDNTGYIEAGLRGDPKPITITATQSGQTVSYTFDFGAFCQIRPTALPPVFVHAIASQTLTVGQPVTGRSIDLGSAFLDPTVVVGPYMSDWQIQINGIPFGLTPPANDQNLSVASPQLYLTGTPTTTGVYTLTIIARTVPFPNQPVATTFTITVVPAPATTGALTLLAPTYDCTSGGFTFRSSGGNGSPIEYQAAGITGWTTNPNQFVDKDSRTANDVKPFTLMARQNGQTATLTWDLKAACGRARQQAESTESPLKLTVLGNPVQEQLRVLIQGADSQPVTLRLTDLTGRLVESRTVLQSEVGQEHVFELHRQPAGLLLLRATSGTRQHTVKVLKK